MHHSKYSEKDRKEYLETHPCSFEKCSSDDQHQEKLCMFSIPSQHVYGSCINECLDKAIDISKSPPCHHPAPKWFNDIFIGAFSKTIDHYIENLKGTTRFHPPFTTA